MNRKIPFHELASLLATNCNITPDEAEDFVKNFFDLIAQTLIAGETVKIKGVGTFTPTGDADDPIAFTPDAVIADTINAPFALFEPEEVSDTLTDAELSELDEPIHDEPAHVEEAHEEETHEEVIAPTEEVEEEIAVTTVPAEPEVKEPEVTEAVATAEPETTITEEPKPVAETVEETVSDSAPETVAEAVPETAVEPTPESTAPVASVSAPVATPPVTPTAHPAPSSFPDEEPEEYITEHENKSGGSFGMGFLIGILVGLALGACAVYFTIDYIFPTNPSITESVEESVTDDPISDLIASTDTIAVPADTQSTDTVATEPAAIAERVMAEEHVAEQPKAEQPVADTPAQAASQTVNKTVKDTIKKGYLLNDMAKKHYGNKCFWVYIYEENKAKIANPNRVSVGLELVIPDPAKYGIDASSQASVSAANAKAGKILSKFSR